MKKTTAALLLTLALVGCAPNPAQNVPAATVNSPAAGETPVAMATGGETPAGVPTVYKITPETSKIQWTASKVTRSHEGGFKKFEGEIGVASGDPEKSKVLVKIDNDSLFADEEDLTSHLKGADFFDVAKIPQSAFESKMIQKAGEGYQMTGDLTLHGVTKSITFPANITVAPEEVTAKAEFAINRMDFGLKYPGKADDLIRSEVVIKLDLKAPVSR